MAVLLFSLRDVPADEAADVRDLLAQHAIPYYETPAGNWGVSMPALWLYHNEHHLQARQLLAEYQQQRAIVQRQIYLEHKQAGLTPGFFGFLRQNPGRFFTYCSVAGGILYLSFRLLLEMGLEVP